MVEVKDDREKGLEARRGLTGRSTVVPRLGELIDDPSLVGDATGLTSLLFDSSTCAITSCSISFDV